ncbi:MAG TPA: metallophosphoesterase [Kofleriaceae bacterium]|nr:metallophosphoesterase [Kofleriaceae bacterium]
MAGFQRGVSRTQLTASALLYLSTVVACAASQHAGAADVVPSHHDAPRTFRVWVFSDAHVGTDKEAGRESLAEALRQSESSSGFDWDIALDLGDMSGAQGTPKDAEGAEIVRQFAVLKHHRREQVYDLSGNHDRSGLDEPRAWWWRKWLDPTGEHTASSRLDPTRRPFPIDGTWERYSFRVGNLLFAMMSDVNEPTQKVGRGTLGGNPGGVMSGETFRWWKRLVDDNGSSIIISAHHYMLKDTTVASGEWEGVQRDEQGAWQARYHGYYAQGTPQGASFLYWVDSKPDSGAIEHVLSAAPPRVDLWLGGHTHAGPDDTYGNKSHVEQRWGTTFINVAGLTRYHGRFPDNNIPRSWLLTFTEGSDEVTARCYLHGNEYAPQGWYSKVERVIKLSKVFEMQPARQ